MSDAKGEVHVCVVSDQLLPNLIPVLMDHPARVIMVATEDMERKGLVQRFQRLLEDRGVAVDLRTGAPSAGLPKLLDFALQLAGELEGRRVVLNATGGTKLMTLAFVQAFQERLPEASIIYTDTDHNCLEIISEDVTRPMENVVDIPTYLAAYGFSCRQAASDDPGWPVRVRERRSLTEQLTRRAVELRDYLKAINTLKTQAVPDGKKLNASRQRFASPPPQHWHGVLEEAVRLGLVTWSGGEEIIFRDLDAARYLGGGWLEEFAWHVVADEHPKHMAAGVEGAWEGSHRNPSLNEFDLLAVHGNRLLLVECKTGHSKADVSYKLDSLGRNAGGLFGRTFLLSAQTLSADVRARAAGQRIQVIEGADLPKLRDFVRAWMRNG